MSTNKKLLGIGLVLTAFVTMAAAVVSGGSMPQLKTDLFKADAVVDVTTTYSLLLDESWGYNGEATKVKTSTRNNDFTIGFSNNGSDFSGAATGKAFSTTTDGAYIYTVNLLSGISQIYIRGTSTNEKTGVTVYAHHYSQTECVDDSETVDGTLNSLISFEPTNYVAIKFKGTDNIESVEIGYSCSEPSDVIDHLEWGGANGVYNQSFVGFSSSYPVGTKLVIDMDVSVTGGLNDANSMVYAVDSVYSDDSRENYTSIKSLVTESEGWHHITFVATVRNFSQLRNNGAYPKIDTSSVGNGIYILAVTLATKHSFNFRNVEFYEASPARSDKNGNYYQGVVGLQTDLSVGTTVQVEMDVYITGEFSDESYHATGIWWLDTVYANNLWNASTKIVNDTEATTNAGSWYHISFAATVRNFSSCGIFVAVDTSEYGNAVYLVSRQKSLDSFNYKNVEISEIKALISSANTTGNGFYQNMTGLSTDLEVGTTVQVEMDVYVTGSFNEYSSIHWIDTIYGDGSTRNGSTTIYSSFDFSNKTEWQHVTFTATVRIFTNLRWGSAQYNPVDVSAFGNAVYIIAVNNSEGLFNYKNVVITAA